MEKVKNLQVSPSITLTIYEETDTYTSMEEKIYTVKGGVSRPLPSLLGGNALCEAGADDLRVLLALCELEEADTVRIADALGLSTATVETALAFWRGAGLLTCKSAASTATAPKERKSARPLREDSLCELGGAEIAAKVKERGLSELVNAAEQQCGRLFNRTELSILVGLSEELGLDGAYILTLLSYCDSLGDGPKPLRYAERVALRLCEHGIDTCQALEEYIKEQELLHSVEGGLRRMFGIGARKLTPREERAFLTWTQEYGFGEELIGAAYDVTVGATGKASVAYTDKILAHWHEAGIRTVAEAEALLLREKEEKAKGRRPARHTAKEERTSSFDVGDFFQKALDRSYKNGTEQKS